MVRTPKNALIQIPSLIPYGRLSNILALFLPFLSLIVAFFFFFFFCPLNLLFKELDQNHHLFIALEAQKQISMVHTGSVP